MTRRPSLAGRLSRALAACVALALIVMVAVSTLVMRSSGRARERDEFSGVGFAA